MRVPVDPRGPGSRTHWSAIAFTLVLGLSLSVVVGPGLLRPLPTAEVAVAHPSPAATPPIDHTPLPTDVHSAWVGQADPPTLSVGEEVEVWFKFKNVGSVPWVKGGPSELHLGEIGSRPLLPEMRSGWLSWDRPGSQEERVVDPLDVATIRVAVRGAAFGTFRLAVRPVVDGVAWLENEGVFIDITVTE